MTHSRKQAIWGLIVLAGVMVSFTAVFFSSGGPEAFVHDRARILIGAVLIGVGFLSPLLVSHFAGLPSRGQPVVRDERDDLVAQRASGIAFTLTLIYVYVTSLSLWEVYHDEQFVPVGWMWFLAYTSVFFGMLAHAIATLVLDVKVSGHDGA